MRLGAMQYEIAVAPRWGWTVADCLSRVLSLVGFLWLLVFLSVVLATVIHMRPSEVLSTLMAVPTVRKRLWL